MRTAIKLSLRGIRNNLGRLALTLIAITLGVAFVSGSFILSDSLSKLFNGIVSTANANLDARIQPIEDQAFGEEPGVIPDSIVAQLEALPEVDEVSGFVGLPEEFNPIVGLDPEGNPQIPTGPPIITFSWDGESVEGGLELIAGAPPSGANSIAINQDQADALQASVGDTRTFRTPTGEQDFTIDGIISFPGGGAWFLLFDLEEGQRQYDKEGILDAAAITAAEGVLPSSLISAVEAELPRGVEAVDQAAANEADSEGFNQFISIFGNVLLGFAAVALFVSLFIIYNTFAILVSQRVQQIGMLRAIGATKSQVRINVLVEAAIVGIVGSILGLFGGLAVSSSIKALFESQGGFPSVENVITTRTVVVSIAVGLVSTIISALLPAFKAAKISPVEAIRSEGTAEEGGRVRILIGAVITAVGLLLVGLGLAGRGGVQGVLTLLGIGAILTFVGVALLSALFAGPAVRLLGRSPIVAFLGTISGFLLLIFGLAMTVGGAVGTAFLLAAPTELTIPGQDGAADQVIELPQNRTFFIILAILILGLGLLFLVSSPKAIIDGLRLGKDSVTGGSEKKMVALSRQNAARSPQRTAATATALMIGLALVTLVSVLGASLQKSLFSILETDVGADLFVANETDGVLPDAVGPALAEVEGITDVSEFRVGSIRLGGEGGDVYRITAFTAASEDRILDYGLTEGDFAAAQAGTGILVNQTTFDAEGYSLGQELVVEFEDRETETLTISGVVGNEGFLDGSFAVDNSVFVRHNPDTPITSIAANVIDSADPAVVKAAAIEATSGFASVVVADNEDFKEQIEQGIGGLLVVINALLGLALFVAFFGVVNTIVLSVLERTREIGLMRAIGMTRGQLMSTIRWEAIMVSLFGTLLGIALGILFAIAGVRAIPDTVINTVAIPWTTLVIIVIMAGLIGVLAAYLPARRAAKLNPLDAISSL